MTTSQITPASLMGFAKYAKLPLELRLNVIEELINIPDELNVRTRLAPLASVNSEWNQVIERVLFKRIKINKGESEDFGTICGKRQNLLDRISLNLELSDPRNSNHVALNQGIVTDNVSELFHALKGWNCTERSHRLIALSIRIDSRISGWTNGGWAVESLNYDFTDLPEVTVIGNMFTIERPGDTYFLHHSTVDALHKKLPSLHGVSIAFPSRLPVQETIDIASSKHIATSTLYSLF